MRYVWAWDLSLLRFARRQSGEMPKRKTALACFTTAVKVCHRITRKRRRGFAEQLTKAIQMHSLTLPRFTGMARVYRETMPYLRFGTTKRQNRARRKLKSGSETFTQMAEVSLKITLRRLPGTVSRRTKATLPHRTGSE